MSSFLAVNEASLDRDARAPNLPIRHIVILHDDVSSDDYIHRFGNSPPRILGYDELEASIQSTDKPVITHTNWLAGVLNGFSGVFSQEVIDELQRDKNVAVVAKEVLAYTCGAQQNATWGLQRISQRHRLSQGAPNSMGYVYNITDYPQHESPIDVDVYVVDTGIFADHEAFGGRASHGFTVAPPAGTKADYANDSHGHGTHIAGIIGGDHYGVATNANIISVKVTDSHIMSDLDIINALGWINKRPRDERRASIVNISLSTKKPSIPLDRAVRNLTEAGFHVVVAAGNFGTDAGVCSPARSEFAITVGASDMADNIIPMSNFGRSVNLYAPGYQIESCGIGSTRNTAVMTGTSMSAAYVSGIVAHLISMTGRNISPAAMLTWVCRLAEANARGYHKLEDANTNPIIAYNGV